MGQPELFDRITIIDIGPRSDGQPQSEPEPQTETAAIVETFLRG